MKPQTIKSGAFMRTRLSALLFLALLLSSCVFNQDKQNRPIRWVNYGFA